MSYQHPLVERFKAAVDLSGSKYCQVALVTDKNTVTLPTVDSVAIGILQNAPKLGEEAEVVVQGGALLKCNGVVTQGLSVGIAATGQGKAAVSTKFCLCIAKETAAAGDVIEVLIDRHYFP